MTEFRNARDGKIKGKTETELEIRFRFRQTARNGLITTRKNLYDTTQAGPLPGRAARATFPQKLMLDTDWMPAN